MRGLMLLPILLLAACGSGPSVDHAVDAFDPLTADPAALQVITEHPAAASLRRFGTVTLTVENTQPVLTQVFPLVAHSEQKVDGTLRQFFALAPADVSRFRALQGDITVLKSRSSQNLKGSFAVEVGACRVGPPPEVPVPFRVWVQVPGPTQPALVFESPDILAPSAKVPGRETCKT